MHGSWAFHLTSSRFSPLFFHCSGAVRLNTRCPFAEHEETPAADKPAEETAA